MKIIAIDNFDRDWVSDTLICENINEYYGKIIVDYLNEKEGEKSQNFYVLKEDDYKLYVYED